MKTIKVIQSIEAILACKEMNCKHCIATLKELRLEAIANEQQEQNGP